MKKTAQSNAGNSKNAGQKTDNKQKNLFFINARIFLLKDFIIFLENSFKKRINLFQF